MLVKNSIFIVLLPISDNVSIDLRHLFMKQQTIMGSTMGSVSTFKKVLEKNKLQMIVIPSMRTPNNIIDLANDYFGKEHLIIKNVDKKAYLSGLSLAKYIIVTCDSTSMISEAATSGKPIFVAHMKPKKNNYRFQKFFKLLREMGITRDLGEKVEPWTYNKHNEAERIGNLIKDKIKKTLRSHVSPRHVPSKIIAVSEIPKTKNGKLMELAVKKTVEGEAIKNLESLANPNSLEQFKNIKELSE